MKKIKKTKFILCKLLYGFIATLILFCSPSETNSLPEETANNSKIELYNTNSTPYPNPLDDSTGTD